MLRETRSSDAEIGFYLYRVSGYTDPHEAQQGGRSVRGRGALRQRVEQYRILSRFAGVSFVARNTLLAGGSNPVSVDGGFVAAADIRAVARREASLSGRE